MHHISLKLRALRQIFWRLHCEIKTSAHFQILYILDYSLDRFCLLHISPRSNLKFRPAHIAANIIMQTKIPLNTSCLLWNNCVFSTVRVVPNLQKGHCKVLLGEKGVKLIINLFIQFTWPNVSWLCFFVSFRKTYFYS